MKGLNALRQKDLETEEFRRSFHFSVSNPESFRGCLKFFVSAIFGSHLGVLQLGAVAAASAADSTSAAPAITIPPASVALEQTNPGSKPPAQIVASFDGLGEGFVGPQGTGRFRNPSDNTLAVGPDHIVQVVNAVMAIYTK
jgi:hypothetical protein